MTDLNYFKQQLKKFLDNEEQCVFEHWMRRTDPHGCCDAVHSQWIDSADYSDFIVQFESLFVLLGHEKLSSS